MRVSACCRLAQAAETSHVLQLLVATSSKMGEAVHVKLVFSWTAALESTAAQQQASAGSCGKGDALGRQ
jgi:hypothetical protein